MDRAHALTGVVAALLLVACGGGSSSPTEPDPVPDSLAGAWRGEMTGADGGAAFTCALEVDLDDAGDGIFVGSWRAECPDATVAGVATGNSIAGFTFLTGLRSGVETPAHVLGGCGWASPVTLQGSELTGTWEPPQSCEDAGLTGGPLRLRFVG